MHKPALHSLIIAAPTPAEAFALAHAHEEDVIAEWDTHHKKRDMFRAVIFKFKQHKHLQVTFVHSSASQHLTGLTLPSEAADCN
jgi:predicted NAD-dependent protein-ADP-ribosyltransferase YbiA (DUF1768 family)